MDARTAAELAERCLGLVSEALPTRSFPTVAEIASEWARHPTRADRATRAFEHGTRPLEAQLAIEDELQKADGDEDLPDGVNRFLEGVLPEFKGA